MSDLNRKRDRNGDFPSSANEGGDCPRNSMDTLVERMMQLESPSRPRTETEIAEDEERELVQGSPPVMVAVPAKVPVAPVNSVSTSSSSSLTAKTSEGQLPPRRKRQRLQLQNPRIEGRPAISPEHLAEDGTDYEGNGYKSDYSRIPKPKPKPELNKYRFLASISTARFKPKGSEDKGRILDKPSNCSPPPIHVSVIRTPERIDPDQHLFKSPLPSTATASPTLEAGSLDHLNPKPTSKRQGGRDSNRTSSGSNSRPRPLQRQQVKLPVKRNPKAILAPENKSSSEGITERKRPSTDFQVKIKKKSMKLTSESGKQPKPSKSGPKKAFRLRPIEDKEHLEKTDNQIFKKASKSTEPRSPSLPPDSLLIFLSSDESPGSDN